MLSASLLDQVGHSLVVSAAQIKPKDLHEKINETDNTFMEI